MGINFSGMSDENAASVVSGSAEEASTPTGIVLNLSKGAVVDLSKKEPGMKNVTVLALWDLLNDSADLDISAFLLAENGKVTKAEDIVYFNQPEAPGIKKNGDNTTGGGDGESMEIALDKIPSYCQSIVFVVNIFEAMEKKQTFGMVDNACVKILNKDAGNKEVCNFSLKDDYSSCTGVILAKMTRGSDGWSFEAVGQGKVVKDLNDLIAIYSN